MDLMKSIAQCVVDGEADMMEELIHKGLVDEGKSAQEFGLGYLVLNDKARHFAPRHFGFCSKCDQLAAAGKQKFTSN